MAQRNNFSVLPWYESTKEQDFRKWWVYGHIYPLYGETGYIIPSQIERNGHYTAPNIESPYISNGQDDGQALDVGGNVVAVPGDEWEVISYSFADNSDAPLIITRADRYNGGAAWVIWDSNDMIVAYGTDIGLIDPADYTGATTLLVTRYKAHEMETVWKAANGGASETALPIAMEVYTPGGEFVTGIPPARLWKAKTVDGNDYIVSDVNEGFSPRIPKGQYYIKMWDEYSEWYSDVFTAISNDELQRLVRVRWYDDDDFVMDAGRIVYTAPTFRNELYLRAEIAKPKYEFEENGDTRDGVFYPTKLISKKVYQMHILAPEYLLDVMRLIRMADHVNITTWREFGIPYTIDASAFLITPEWEAEGDVAAVTIEFETNTIAKKIGLAYIR